MRKAIGIGGFGAIAIAAMFMLTTVPLAGAYEYSAQFSLQAGKKEIGATIDIIHDDTNVYVTYTLTGDWWLSETQVGVSFQEDCPDDTNPTDIPAKNGNPTPGKFQYKATHDPMVQTYTYEIPFPEGFEFDDDYVCLATHAVVNKVIDDVVVEQQTGWAGDHDFTGKNWALFFCYQPGEPHKILKVPTGTFSTYCDLDQTDSYWDATVTIPDVAGNEQYQYIESWIEAWCIETGEYLSDGQTVSFQLISSLEVPANFYVYDAGTASDVLVTQTNMNKVNWILNTYYDNIGTYHWKDVQWAIWKTIGLTPSFSPVHLTLAQGLVLNADGTFVPMHGDYAAMILHHANNQDLILAIDP